MQHTPFGFLHRASGTFLTWREYFDRVDRGAAQEEEKEWPGMQPASGGWKSDDGVFISDADLAQLEASGKTVRGWFPVESEHAESG